MSSGAPPAVPGASVLDDPGESGQVFRLALATGGAWAEVFHEVRVDDTALRESAGKTIHHTELNGGFAIRVNRGDLSCHVFAPADRPAALPDLARQAARVFQAVSHQAQADASDYPAAQPADRGDHDAAVSPHLAHDPAHLDHVTASALSAAFDGPLIDTARVRLHAWGRQTVVVTSDGLRCATVDRGTNLAVEAFASSGGLRRKGRASWLRAATPDRLTDAEAEQVARRASAQACRLLLTGAPVRGDMPVVLAPAAAGLAVHELFGHSCEADAVAARRSLGAGECDQRIADAIVSLADGFAGPDVFGSYAVDDEGERNREIVLIRDGIFVGAVTDRDHALAAGHPLSTGNGRRQSYQHPVLPRASTSRLAAGQISQDQIIAGVREGLLVLAAEGGAVNPRSGVMSISVREGRLIRNGEPGALVSGVALTGNARSVARAIRQVGNDPDTTSLLCGKQGQWVPVSAQAPTLLIERMRVIGS